jgi:hypothetical protein
LGAKANAHKAGGRVILERSVGTMHTLLDIYRKSDFFFYLIFTIIILFSDERDNESIAWRYGK